MTATFRPRNESPRFSVGDRIVIQEVISTSHSGKPGTVVNIRRSRHSVTLDKYRVRLDAGPELDFWDIQLKTA